MTSRARLAPFRRTLLALGAALALWAILASLFTVDVTEYGIVTRFGRVVQVADAPGLHAKAPFDRVIRVDKRLLYSKPAQAEYLTEDKKNVVVRSLVVFRIADPKRYLATLGTRPEAELRLADVVLAEIGAVLGAYPFSSLISSDDPSSRFPAMIAEVRAAVADFVRPAYGIEVVEVDMRQLFLPEANQRSVFERMKAERGRMAKQFRSEGERDSTRMIAAAEREKTRMLAEAHGEAARIRAAGEAEAMRIYARAFGQDASFYKFLRTLQAYEKFLDGRTTVFLPADAEVFEILHVDATAERPAGPRPPTQAPGPDGLAEDAEARRPFVSAAEEKRRDGAVVRGVEPSEPGAVREDEARP